MAVAPLEVLANPAGGSVATAANFGGPLYDLATALLGTAAGGPDTNNGGPVVPRTAASGFLSYTNAEGFMLYPGAEPFDIYGTQSGAGGYAIIVPAGQQLVVSLLCRDGQAASGGNVLVNDGTGAATLAVMSANDKAFYAGFPVVLDTGWILTVPVNCSALGHFLLRDAAVAPVCKSVTNSTTYTVTAGKTLWLLGCTNPGGSAAYLQAGSQPLCFPPAVVDNAGPGNGSPVNGHPIPVSAGVVVQSSNGQALTFWGCEL